MTAARAEKIRVAADIRNYLQHFERDPVINKPDGARMRPYYNAGAHSVGRYTHVTYISYQGPSKLTPEEAVRYLAWLDAGNVGRHFEAFRDGAKGATP